MNFAGFQLLSEIGSGATSVVHKAERNGEIVAIKVMKKVRTDRAVAAALQFRNEAVVIARLSHQALVKIVEVGEFEGQTYVAMELVNGVSLSELIKKGELLEDQTVKIAAQIAQALSYVHRHGLVHRDIKPDNILVLETGEIKLIDFGFAAANEDDGEKSGEIIGTFLYAAPEQSGMLNRSVDARSDLYALGGVIYECLTSSNVYEAKSLVELMQKHASAPIPDVRALKPSTRPVLAKIVTKLLAKDPDDRYQTAEGLADDLGNLPELEHDEREGKLSLDAKRGKIRLTHDVPLVGRDLEFSKLKEGWASVIDGKGSIIQIEGEGGLGKTRLTQELLNIALAQDALVIRGKCQVNEVVPFGVIREAIDEYIVRILKLPEEEKNRQIDIINDAAGDMAPVIRRLSRGLEKVLKNQAQAAAMDANTEQARFFDGIAGFLLALSEKRGPLLLLIDDTQWIDSSTIEVLKRVAKEIGKKHIMMLTTARNDSASQAAATKFVEELSAKKVERLVLTPLSIDAVDEFVKAFLGGRGLGRDLVEKLANVTHGNVFAIGEYIRTMLSSGVLTPRAGLWEADAAKFSQLTVSSNVLQLIVSRIQGLSKETLNILSTAAVCGSTFAQELLVSALKVKDSTVSHALDEAVRASLLERTDMEGFAFVHDRVREALLERLSEDELKDRNQSLADALMARISDSPDQIFPLARYYIQGHPDQNKDQAYRACLRAGRFALSSYANEDAYELLGHAMRLRQAILSAGGRVGENIELDEALGQACLRIGRLTEAHEHFSRCLRLARTTSDLARMHLQICVTYANEGKHGAGWVSIEKCLQALGRPVPKSQFMLVVGTIWFAFWGVVLDKLGIAYGAARRLEKSRRKVISQIMPVTSQITTILGQIHITTYFAAREYVSSFFLGTTPERARSLTYVAYTLASFNVYSYRTRYGFLRLSDKLKWKLIDYYTQRGFSIASQTNDLAMFAFCHYGTAISNIMAGRLVIAEKWSREALPLLKKYCGYNYPTLNIYWMAFNYSWRGLSREVVDLVNTEHETLIKSDNLTNQALSFGNAFVQLSLMGRMSEALKMKERWFTIVNALKDNPFIQAFMWCQLLWVMLDEREFGKEAEEYIANYRKQGVHYCLLPMFDVVIGYVRLAQMLKAEKVQRQHFKKEVAEIIRDIEHYQGYAPFLCHAFVLRSALAQEAGNFPQALQHLDRAQALALEADSKWGFFEVAFQKARVALQMGDETTAKVMAQVAYRLAMDQGWKNKSKYVFNEFKLEEQHKSFTSSPSSLVSSPTSPMGTGGKIHNIRAEGYIEALLRVSLASAGSLDLKSQARAALDELVKVLNAERAFLFLVRSGADANALDLEAGRDNAGKDLAELGGYSSTVVKKVCETRKPLVLSGTDEGEVLGSQSAVVHNLRSIIAAPLLMKEKLLGVIYLDNRMAKGVFTSNEVEILSAISAHIAISIETTQMARIDAERRELQKDLALTAAVQSFFLPERNTHRFGNLSLHGVYRAASQASGDWWWYSDISENSLDVLVGDVTGHGPAAAMLTASTASCLLSIWKRNRRIKMGDLLAEVNNEFNDFSKDKYSMTMSALSVDQATNTLRWWNAGSPPIFVLRNDGMLHTLACPGTPLGTRDFESGYKEMGLSTGDRVLIFTDGLSELELPSGTDLKTKGLAKILTKSRPYRLDEAVEFINQEIDQAKKDVPLRDDITYVLLDVQ